MPPKTDKKPAPATAGQANASPARDAPLARASVVLKSRQRKKNSTTGDKILASLIALSERMTKMESSHREQDENERTLGANVSGMLASALGTMTIEVLTESPQQKPATRTPRTHVADLEESTFASLAPPHRQTSMYQRGQVRAPTIAAGPHPAGGAPVGQIHTTQEFFATPNASQRNLSTRKFDETELYKGLESVFFQLGPHVLWVVNLTESAYGSR